jgi:hypothetical protein
MKQMIEGGAIGGGQLVPSQSGRQQQLVRLQQAHHSLEAELEGLTRRAYLTPSEETRARAIKKQKLQTKDRMRVLKTRATFE